MTSGQAATRRVRRPRTHLLHGIFEARAAVDPDAVAVDADGRATTYGELDRDADRIARRLRTLGVGRGDLVAVILPRSAEAYASLLGVLKSGAGYVPLDPGTPADRVRWILKDCDAAAVIASPGTAGPAARFHGPVLLPGEVIDDDCQDQEETVDEAEDPGPRDLCYVIYTSGSTGRPKGVMVEHRSACHLVRAEGGIFRVRPGDRVYQGFSLAFDASVEEVWLAFRSGATLVPATPEMARAGPDLPALLAAAGVTVLSCVPSLLAELEGDVPTLRLLILGGEACPEGLVERWARPGLRIVNTYGPTEATVIATWAELAPVSPVTLGRAVPGYRIHVLDDELRPVPEGGTGEICIGGPGVARGYVGLPGLTRQRFVPDPFGAGDRLYRSGDLGRFGPAGELEFLGRADSQVKVRGYRVELAEIESALLRDGEVRAAACALREDAPGGPALVAYAVPRNGTPLDAARLREGLRRVLPAHMVPSLLEVVPDLPRLPSGKLDRAALPAPRARPTQPGRSRAPCTDAERRVLDCWRRLLRPLPVDLDDDFFVDLGGHSLLAARMVSALRRDGGFPQAAVIDVYEHPTAASLAAALERRSPAGPSPCPSPARSPVLEARERRRHARAGILQAAGLLPVAAFRAIPWVGPYLVGFLLLEEGYPAWVAAAWAAGTAAAAFPLLLLAAAAAKWCLLGRVRAGSHHLWGSFHVRWWLVQNLVNSLHLDRLGGSPLLGPALRLFGVRVGRDAWIATDDVAAFDLVSIGDGASIDEEASLLGSRVEGGRLHLGPVTVGSGCFVGVQSVLGEGTEMEDGARLEDLSLLPAGGRIPGGQTWAGAPARPAAAPAPRPRVLPWTVRPAAEAALYAALALLLPVVPLLAFLPGVALLARFDPLREPLAYLVLLPAVGASFALLLAVEVAALKWMLVGRVRPGTVPVHGGFYVRHWIVERLLQTSLDLLGPLRATLYMAPWFRALGARLGRFVELSTATSAVPDLLSIDDGGTVADEVSLGAPHVEGGSMTLGDTRIGRRAFLGNSAVINQGTTLGDGSLVGVLTLAPPAEAARPGASWLGSPPFLLPRRQRSAAFGDPRTYEPPRRLVALRAAFEILRVTLPAAGFTLITVTTLAATMALWRGAGPVAALAALPAVFAAACAGILVLVAAAKWALVGRYRPFEVPLWSWLVWRLELSNALYEFLAAPVALDPLAGTPFLPWYLRLLGARLGRRVYLDTTGLLEFDLVEVGDRACLDDACVLQTHLFEDRVLKASPLRIGADCSVGGCSVVLYGSAMEDGSSLDSLSLLMKGETLPARTRWAGIPASPAPRRPHAATPRYPA